MDYMRRAIALSRRALGTVSPNPAVGAVIVKGGTIVGEGFTQPPGGDHAEIVALKQAGGLAKGAVLFSTLEPCSHFGRTPPCADAIVRAGISEVHAAVIDPNPIVAGKGMQRLNDGGIETLVGERSGEAREVMEAFFKYITTGMPFVTVKFAMSLDGRIATSAGDSRWITGEAARRHVHALRAHSDAILVGINTVLADDPQLTARYISGRPRGRQPLRVVVDSRGRLPPTAKLLAQPGKTLVAVADSSDSLRYAMADKGTDIIELKDDKGRVDLSALLSYLAMESKVTSVLVEAGGEITGSLFDLRLVDKVVAFLAPVIIGGKAALSPVGGAGAERMADVLKLTRVKHVRLGPDTMISGYTKEG
ncbi:MAG: bifunctional diaminohydroxyphosphoribosylaminopyrimidine deaminase/5-amino-6-(5-phosphoribosylamino)uracil reductase RibD [SAR202 cluster bacterium]|nr:bifunctional diaminohydroxyphosphoribosylaminopyrimidine deaminase/5-amino-6-(5-phosphoribosylamino)uracil reductase RibD [SAR202 cluster bacterium]